MSDEVGPMQVDVGLVRQLAELLDETKLTEIEVEDGDRKIRVARKAAAVAGYAPAPAAAPPPSAAAAAPSAEAAPAAAAESGTPARSPMVGTVYLSAEPGAKPFVGVGDTVSEGQTIVIIEALKVMKALPAPKAGTIKRI